MKSIFKMKQFVGVTLLSAAIGVPSLAANQSRKQSNREISDSLVLQLNCRSLSVDAIYKAIREDAFHESRNMPIFNWSSMHGLFPLQQCWALSSSQRMFSYLARYNESNTRTDEDRKVLVLNLIRGSAKAQVFEVEGSSIDQSSGFWWHLREGYKKKTSFFTTDTQNFRKNIEASQSSHFFRSENVSMGAGSGPTSPRENKVTAQTLLKNLEGKRLTLVNLRLGRTSQHIVMLKSFLRQANGQIVFMAYDSNQPKKDQELLYDTRTGIFTAPEISRSILGEGTPSNPLGVFIVDEDERKPLEAAMLAHYKKACQN